ncbi:hypothetical protein LEN26_001718 [Aphanomyces euteiches]|nr:hypothetical protein AeMF1_004184 [Aphanomyces euteiches]KAH9160755.1 hypothetical protein LEN26_001718 [Aphanomyces euteiches]KAH9184006.1 hypothetical protein AeNC1_014017 [Aphanomyces euteiches]
MNSDLMEHIAEYLPTYDALIAYLEAFENKAYLDSMQVFRHLPDDIDKGNIWPELHIRQVGWIDTFAPLTVYVKRIHTHCFVDPEALRQILSPHNVLIIECREKNGRDNLSTSWINQMATLPVAEIVMWGMNIEPLVEVLPRMHHLQTLVAEYCSVGFNDEWDKFYDFVAQSRLIRLSIVGMSDLDVGTIRLDNHKLNQLTQWLLNQPVIEFTIAKCKVSANREVLNKFYNALWSCKTLEEFSCFSTKFPKFAVDRISRPIQWRSLNIGECKVNVEMARGLASGLRNSNVESLNLMRNYLFSTESMELIMSSLAQSKVSFVSFAWCRFSLPHVEILAKYLSSTKLRKLNISNTEICVAGIKVLMSAVAQSQLEELNMAYCLTHHEAVEIVTETLPSTKLTRLNLDGNIINDEMVQYLADAIDKSPHLRTFSLAGNHLTLQGIQYLVSKLNGRAPTTLCFSCYDFRRGNAEIIELGNAMVAAAAAQGHKIELYKLDDI